MNEKEAKLEARLLAIELVLSKVCAEAFLQYPDPRATVRASLANLRTKLTTMTLPNVDPALSDFVTAEIGEAIEQIVDEAASMVEKELVRRQGGTEPL